MTEQQFQELLGKAQALIAKGNAEFTKVAIAACAATAVLVLLIRLIGRRQLEAPEGRALWLGRLAMCATMAGALALAVTGFAAPVIFHGRPISGWWLLGHVACGGFFIAGLVGIAVLCADRHRFGAEAAAAGRLRKLFFWLALVLGVATTLTVMFSMTPLSSSHMIETLYYAHRWSALGAVMALIGLGLSR